MGTSLNIKEVMWMTNSDTLELNVPGFYPKQIEFMKSKCRYTAYGGARGGG